MSMQNKEEIEIIFLVAKSDTSCAGRLDIIVELIQAEQTVEEEK